MGKTQGKFKLVHGGGGGGGMRKLAWHFWGGTLCYRVSHASPSLQLSTDTAGKGPACSLPCLSSGAFSCLSDTAEKGPAVSTATLQKS